MRPVPTPFFRDQGAGVGVVCLHSNASSSSQWRALADALSDRYRVVAVDGYGAGRSPEWAGDRPLRLEDEMALLDPVLALFTEPVHIVGHSYGAAVALKLAMLQPGRVRSVVVYEPTLFSLVAGDDPSRSRASGIWHAATDAAEAADRGDRAAAAERFIDFWMGSGAWAAMPPARQAGIEHAVRHVRAWRDALLGEPDPRSALAVLALPVLCLGGETSPESSRSVLRALQETLPDRMMAIEPGLGHMGPITHPERVNARIAAFLDSH